MVQQRPDICFIKGLSYALKNCPLDPLLNEVGLEVDRGGEQPVADCWRGYVATWAVQGDQQFLVSVRRSGDQARVQFKASGLVHHCVDRPMSSRLTPLAQRQLRDWLLSEQRVPLRVDWLDGGLCLA